MYLTLYQPEVDLFTISIVVFLGIVAKILEEVEALFLRLRLAVVTPLSEEVEGVLVELLVEPLLLELLLLLLSFI